MRYAILTPNAAVGQQSKPWLIGDDALSRGAGSRYIISGWPTVSHIVQNIAYLNGLFTANLPQGNRDIRLGLTVDHQFADESECFLFICRLGLDCPTYGYLEMGVRGSGGGRVAFPAAVLEAVETFDATQVSVKLNYRFCLGRPG